MPDPSFRSLSTPIVVALDLDGTLLRSDGSVSSATQSALIDLARFDIRPVVVTARPPRTTEVLIAHVLPHAPRVCYSGAWVAIDGARLVYDPIPTETARQSIDLLRERAPDVGLAVEIEDVLYCERPMPLIQKPEYIDFSCPLDRPPVKIVVDLRDDALPPDLLENLPSGIRCDVLDGGRMGILMRDTVTKVSGLQHVLDRWSLSLDHVIAFGDDFSDLPLLQAARIGVAMSNAPDQVRAVADHVAPTNDDDGVARTLQSLLATL